MNNVLLMMNQYRTLSLPFYKAYIDWNLDIRLCCHDWKDKIVISNLREERFDSIWACKKYNEYRIKQRSKSPHKL